MRGSNRKEGYLITCEGKVTWETGKAKLERLQSKATCETGRLVETGGKATWETGRQAFRDCKPR